MASANVDSLKERSTVMRCAVVSPQETLNQDGLRGLDIRSAEASGSRLAGRIRWPDRMSALGNCPLECFW